MDKANYILLIDDDQINNFLNEKLLRKLDICQDIRIFLNGGTALGFLQEESEKGMSSPELIFVDINMPMMDGFEFLEKYNQLHFSNRSRVHIIGLTTSTHPKDIQKLKELNCSFVLNKPLSEASLKTAIPLPIGSVN